MNLPAYAYVPGRGWPHPTRDPRGHSFGREVSVVPALDPDAWQSNEAWLEAIELFDHGYYWEAHEAWEGLWVAAGRAGAMGDFLNGLIKLAAAGVKIRQGKAPQANRLACLASERFGRAQAEVGSARLAGLAFARLHALAGQAIALEAVEADSNVGVATVFDGGLSDR